MEPGVPQRRREYEEIMLRGYTGTKRTLSDAVEFAERRKNRSPCFQTNDHLKPLVFPGSVIAHDSEAGPQLKNSPEQMRALNLDQLVQCNETTAAVFKHAPTLVAS